MKIIQSENRIFTKCDGDDHLQRKLPWTESGSVWQLINIIYSRIYCNYARSFRRRKATWRQLSRCAFCEFRIGERSETNHSMSRRDKFGVHQSRSKLTKIKILDYLSRASHNFARRIRASKDNVLTKNKFRRKVKKKTRSRGEKDL